MGTERIRSLGEMKEIRRLASLFECTPGREVDDEDGLRCGGIAETGGEEGDRAEEAVLIRAAGGSYGDQLSIKPRKFCTEKLTSSSEMTFSCSPKIPAVLSKPTPASPGPGCG